MVEPRDLWRFLSDARGSGVHSADWIRVVARTLAAARLLSDRGGINLLRAETELTAQRWLEMQHKADQLWREELSDQGEVSPFAHRADHDQLPPGQYESIRRFLAMICGDLTNTDCIFELCIELLHLEDDRRGDFSVRREICELISSLLATETTRTAYCAFASAGEVALRLARTGVKVTLDIPNASEASLWAALALATGRNLSVHRREPFEELLRDWPAVTSMFDATCVVPPFNAKVRLEYPIQMGLPPATSEAWGITLASVRSRNIGACLVANGFLFRTSMGDQAFKSKLLTRYGLSAVIGFPGGAAIAQSGISTALLVVAPIAEHHSVRMVDTSSLIEGRRSISDSVIEAVQSSITDGGPANLCRTVPLSEIANNNFNLLPDRYVQDENSVRLRDILREGKAVSVEDLAEIYRPQPTPPSSPVDEEAFPYRREIFHELAVSDLDEAGIAMTPAKQVALESGAAFKVRKAQLEVGDVLVVTKGSVGRVGFVRSVPLNHPWIANQSFAILRLRKNGPLRDSRLLFRYLSSDIGQSQLMNLKVGSAVATLQLADLRKLLVMLPPEEVQADVIAGVEEHFDGQERINALRQSLAGRWAALWPDSGI